MKKAKNIVLEKTTPIITCVDDNPVEDNVRRNKKRTGAVVMPPSLVAILIGTVPATASPVPSPKKEKVPRPVRAADSDSEPEIPEDEEEIVEEEIDEEENVGVVEENVGVVEENDDAFWACIDTFAWRNKSDSIMLKNSVLKTYNRIPNNGQFLQNVINYSDQLTALVSESFIKLNVNSEEQKRLITTHCVLLGKNFYNMLLENPETIEFIIELEEYQYFYPYDL